MSDWRELHRLIFGPPKQWRATLWPAYDAAVDYADVMACIGCVNETEIAGFAPGTLLCSGADVRLPDGGQDTIQLEFSEHSDGWKYAVWDGGRKIYEFRIYRNTRFERLFLCERVEWLEVVA
ncbi:MAG: hypothetical protein PHU85_07250 [Phycisphaerae bacterium]|nr:hypothetical protein [Phycisphaerae bacterium]